MEESLAPHDTNSPDLPDQSDSSLAKDAGIDDIGNNTDGVGEQSANDDPSGYGYGGGDGYGGDGGDGGGDGG